MIEVAPEVVGANYMVYDEQGCMVGYGRLAGTLTILSLDAFATGRQLHMFNESARSAAFVVVH